MIWIILLILLVLFIISLIQDIRNADSPESQARLRANQSIQDARRRNRSKK